MVAVEPVSLRFVRPEWSHEVPSPPHDALSPAARRQHLLEHPRSYLGVTRSLEDVDPSSDDPAEDAMRLSRASLEALLTDQTFGPVQAPALYIYRLEEGGHRQTGLVCGVGASAYDAGQVRIHERIKQPRAELLARHLDRVGAQSSPIALAFRSVPAVEAVIERVTSSTAPFIDLVDDDLHQSLWSIPDDDTTSICTALAPEHLYLIDGHHRAAAASAHQRMTGTTDQLMLSVLFPFRELRNLAFHRLVQPVDSDELLAGLGRRFTVQPAASVAEVIDRPAGWVALAVGGETTRWYLIDLPPPGRELDIDPVRLAQHVLDPVLGIDESTGDPRLVHQPGPSDAEAAAALELEPDQVAFWMRPVPGDLLLHVADRGGTMPPKSTYFVPKVRSGLFVRLTDPDLHA